MQRLAAARAAVESASEAERCALVPSDDDAFNASELAISKAALSVALRRHARDGAHARWTACQAAEQWTGFSRSAALKSVVDVDLGNSCAAQKAALRTREVVCKAGSGASWAMARTRARLASEACHLKQVEVQRAAVVATKAASDVEKLVRLEATARAEAASAEWMHAEVERLAALSTESVGKAESDAEEAFLSASTNHAVPTASSATTAGAWSRLESSRGQLQVAHQAKGRAEEALSLKRAVLMDLKAELTSAELYKEETKGLHLAAKAQVCLSLMHRTKLVAVIRNADASVDPLAGGSRASKRVNSPTT